MNCLFVIVGKSGCGKTTFLTRVMDYYMTIARDCKGLHHVLEYTTRPPRVEESYGKDYYFRTNATFPTKDREGEHLVTCQEFNNWKYGIVDDGELFTRDGSIMCSNLKAAIDLDHYASEDPSRLLVVIHLTISNEVALSRSIQRELRKGNDEDFSELSRRFLSELDLDTKISSQKWGNQTIYLNLSNDAEWNNKQVRYAASVMRSILQ